VTDSAFLSPAERETRYRRLPPDKPGKVYVLFDHSVRAYKIGFTTRTAKRRLREMRTGHPGAIDIVWQGAGTPADEAALHALLAPSWLSGEWFASTGIVRVAVALLCEYGARFVGEMQINQLKTFIPVGRASIRLPRFQNIQPLSAWGSGGYWPEWSTSP
jgi:hypothetical protein